MPNALVEFLAGGFYLLQKILFFFSELARTKKVYRQWRIPGWGVYILGLGPWVYIFVKDKKWIAAWLELGGLPAMILGLVGAITMSVKEDEEVDEEKSEEKPTFTWAEIVVIIASAIGIGFSLYYYGSLESLEQGLQLTMVIGFIAGTYLLAKHRLEGYLCYALMNASNAWLMNILNREMLYYQQIASLIFVIGAFLAKRHRQKKSTEKIKGE